MVHTAPSWPGASRPKLRMPFALKDCFTEFCNFHTISLGRIREEDTVCFAVKQTCSYRCSPPPPPPPKGILMLLNPASLVSQLGCLLHVQHVKVSEILQTRMTSVRSELLACHQFTGYYTAMEGLLRSPGNLKRWRVAEDRASKEAYCGWSPCIIYI